MINEERFYNKHTAYYVDRNENPIKKYDEYVEAFTQERFIEKLEKRTGHRRYYDYSEKKWFAV